MHVFKGSYNLTIKKDSEVITVLLIGVSRPQGSYVILNESLHLFNIQNHGGSCLSTCPIQNNTCYIYLLIETEQIPHCVSKSVNCVCWNRMINDDNCKHAVLSHTLLTGGCC